MIDDEVQKLLAKTQMLMFETTSTALLVYIDPKLNWQIRDMEIVYANPAAKKLMPMETRGEWNAYDVSTINTLQGIRYAARDAMDCGSTGFLGPYQYSTINSNGDSVHVEFKGMIVGDTSLGRISLIAAMDVTARVFRERIDAGGHAISSASINRLTDRERSIALLIVEGLSTKEIATELSISDRTVDNHRANIRKKMNLTDRTITITECLSNF